MADLEDFFAKRDKKKKTAKGKRFEADDVKEILDAKAKALKNKETHKSTYVAPPSDVPEAPLSDYKVTTPYPILRLRHLRSVYAY